MTAPESAAVVTLAELRRTRQAYLRLQRAFRVIVPISVLAVTAVALRGIPPHGAARIAALTALVGFAVGAAGALYVRGRHRVAHIALLLILLVASTVLLVVEPGRIGALGFVIALALTPWRPSRVPTGAIAGVVAALVLLAVVVSDRMSLANALFTAAALAGLAAITYLAQRLNAVNRLAEDLLADLEAGRERELRLAAFAERQSVARELHDVLAHSLSGLLLQLEGARVLAVESPLDPRLPATVDRAHQLARAGLDEARQAIGALRDDGSLPGPARFDGLVEAFSLSSGVPCRLQIVGPSRELAPVVRVNVYRVAQEALTNVAKHSASTSATVCLAYEPDRVRLVVENLADRPADAFRHGYGLSGMCERAELLGGTLSAVPTPTGFRVELVVPG